MRKVAKSELRENNMTLEKVRTLALWALIVFGLLGAVKISYSNLTGNPCPHIVFVPICYVVLIAYGLMAISIVTKGDGLTHYFFGIGWGVAFLIALAGSVAEFAMGGGVCPSSGGGSLRAGAENTGTPLCYVSLVFLIVILILFLTGPYRKTCDAHNAGLEI